MRLNNLRLKELRKVTRHGALKPLSMDKKTEDTTSRQGRITDDRGEANSDENNYGNDN